jgi:hypothetical protein
VSGQLMQDGCLMQVVHEDAGLLREDQKGSPRGDKLAGHIIV